MIHTVTITGADDKIDPADLQKLSEKYPFVEWGILFSESKTGAERYPSKEWISDLYNRPSSMKFSCHLCGSLTKKFLSGDESFINFVPTTDNFSFLDVFTRMQLNFNLNHYHVELFEFVRIINKVMEKNPEFRFILQYNKPNKEFMDFLIEYGPDEMNYLFDASGGNGVSPEGWPQSLPNPCGYAGGLNPDNLDAEIQKILKASNGDSIWIDAESGIRTNNQLDLDKVERFLNIAYKYVKATI